MFFTCSTQLADVAPYQYTHATIFLLLLFFLFSQLDVKSTLVVFQENARSARDLVIAREINND